MPELYLTIVILLFVLAISDLIVGVSNDAVNFLNSAIGSKVASRKVIMIVASIGIFIGATFSSGMMEVARKGIFNPEFFFFGEIMIIFLAVMLTDIILLDLFNTIGLPTSTTVSIVFELLGAAVMISLIKILNNGERISAISEYINSSQAFLIISGIFLSVIFAFAIGGIVQLVSRIIFSFNYERKKPIVTALWSGVAMMSMTYFLLFKGMKGASFVTEFIVLWIESNVYILMGASFIFWSLLFLFVAYRGKNVFRIIVLFGTFSLAMAFAGNDLVNFIGVPIAGFESFLAWEASGQGAFDYSMEVLKEPVRTKSFLLILAGLIMIITLWFSKKARSVTETEVNLGRQGEGHERFSPNFLARGIVRYSMAVGGFTKNYIPQTWRDNAEINFQPLEEKTDTAFDLVRASVNLTTASILIAFATSLKLPLSTTYVSFMVAMGTSLADRAWGRDSAVYRVAGVLNVIGGWFATAFIAFTVAAIFSLLIFQFQLSAIISLIGLAIFFIYRSFSFHKKKEKKKEARVQFEANGQSIETEQLFNDLSGRITELLESLSQSFNQSVNGLITENREDIGKARKSVQRLLEKNEDFQYELFQSIKRIKDENTSVSKTILYVFDLEQDIVQSAQLITEVIDNHVNNLLNPLTSDQIKSLQAIRESVILYLEKIASLIVAQSLAKGQEILEHKKVILKKIDQILEKQVIGIKKEHFGARNSQLIFKILLETKDLVAIAGRFVKLYTKTLGK